MENKKQIAVDWLIEQLTPSISLQQKHIDSLKNEAKDMERVQIEDAFGKERIVVNGEGYFKVFNSKQYYNETFKK